MDKSSSSKLYNLNTVLGLGFSYSLHFSYEVQADIQVLASQPSSEVTAALHVGPGKLEESVFAPHKYSFSDADLTLPC